MRSEMEEINVRLDFQAYPARHTCEGADESPKVNIEGLSSPYLAIIMDDPDASGGTFTHWLIWNIRGTDTIPEGISPRDRPGELPGAVQGINDNGTIGYSGPCPPRGRIHRYYMKVYGTDGPLDLEPGANKRMLEGAMRGHIRQFGEAMATFGRR